MPKRCTEQQYHDLATQRGFKWLGPYVSNNEKTNWQCANGHTWTAPRGNIQQGSGCPHCAWHVPKTEDDYCELAARKEVGWIGGFLPKNVDTKTVWRCNQGHIWEATYRSVRKGNGCSYCSKCRKRTEEDYHILASEKGLEWIGILPRNVGVKTEWKCCNEHIYIATYTAVRLGGGCTHCSGRAKKTREDYLALASKHGFELMEQGIPKSVHSNTRWRCKNGHIWNTSYRTISKGARCLHCGKSAPKDRNDYITLAQKSGIEWIGELPPNVHTNTRWRCVKGHGWSACYHGIRKGTRCPRCANMVNGVMASRIQVNIAKMLGLENNVNYPVGNRRIDIAIPEHRIGIEYDAWYWHKDKLDRDKQRVEELLARGWRILAIKSNYMIPPKAEIEAHLGRLVNTNYVELIMEDWGR